MLQGLLSRREYRVTLDVRRDDRLMCLPGSTGLPLAGTEADRPLDKLEVAGVDVGRMPERPACQCGVFRRPEPHRAHRIVERRPDAPQQRDRALLEGLPLTQRLAHPVVRAEFALGQALVGDVLDEPHDAYGCAVFTLDASERPHIANRAVRPDSAILDGHRVVWDGAGAQRGGDRGNASAVFGVDAVEQRVDAWLGCVRCQPVDPIELWRPG